MATTPRGRLAPSPTGAQHVGNARTYLIAWLSARSQGVELAIRMEDIDSPRVKAGAAEEALDDLRWLGLDWDGEVVVQTHRLARYEAALAKLIATEQVYPCTCSRSDIAAAASAPHAEHEGPSYPATCSYRSTSDAETLSAEGRSYAWRFRITDRDAVRTEFVDRVRGLVAIDPRVFGGDFVVWKSAGTPAYQLAVVVDDAAMGITEVVRGDDLLPSTPRQLLLYRALGLRAPEFAHVPLVIGEDGRRLAKRHGDTRLAHLRELGVSAADLIGMLAWSCGCLDRQEPITPNELLSQFEWNAIPREPFVLTESRVSHLLR